MSNLFARSFASDNNAGIHPKVLDAIARANAGHVLGYGDDPFTKEGLEGLEKLFGGFAKAFFVYGGTAANVLGMNAAARSFHSIFCAETAHINVDECGAPEKFIGCKMLPIPSGDGKITVSALAHRLGGVGDQHHVQPRLISITQPTEMGTLYTTEEVRIIADFAHSHGLVLHMDGARVANAVVGLGTDIKEFTRNAGVDILSFGGTKNGMMYGEAVVFFDQQYAANFLFSRKQAMQAASKMRFIGAQFSAMLSQNLWLKNAARANAMAKLLASKIGDIPQIHITQNVQTNAVFATVPRACVPRLQERYPFYVWDEKTSLVRWMTSFDTTSKDVELFSEFIRLSLS